MIQPYPCATDYWRLDEKLWYVAMIRRKPLGEAVGGISVESQYDEGWATLRDPQGRGPGQSKYDYISTEIEVEIPDLRESGELVWTGYAKDETVARLAAFAANLSDLAQPSHGISIARSREDRLIYLAGEDRRERSNAARRALNDELGIPNCDHLVPDPDCKECQKER